MLYYALLFLGVAQALKVGESPQERKECTTAKDCEKPKCGEALCIDDVCVTQEIMCDLPQFCPNGERPVSIPDTCCGFKCPKSRCPDIPGEFQAGICVQQCEKDADCQEDDVDDFSRMVQPVCCSNGCGRVCKTPVSREGESCGRGAFFESPKCMKGLECRPRPLVKGAGRIMDAGNVCQKPCPARSGCRMLCQNGFKKDENGCGTCECNTCPAPEVKCARFCENGFAVDENGCETCDCNKCNPLTCKMFCEEYEKDEDGCTMCKCKQPDKCEPVRCKLFCKNGYVKDEDGCDTCRCKKDPDCDEVTCEKFCEFGFKTGKDGCEICECAEPDVCPLLGCNPNIGCKEKDTTGDGCGDGCECKRPEYNCLSKERWTEEKQAWCCKNKGFCNTCNSAEDCAKVMKMPPGMCGDVDCVDGACKIFEIACDQPVCDDGSFPRPIKGKCCAFEKCPEQCPKAMCEMFCQHGFMKGEDGCPQCKCNEKPQKCEDVRCKMFCKDGYVKDENGCEKCECVKRECSKFMCRMKCENGFKKDKDGCPMCQCADDDEECTIDVAKQNIKSGKCPIAMCIKPPCKDPVILPPSLTEDGCCLKQCNFRCEDKCTLDMAKENMSKPGRCPVAGCMQPPKKEECSRWKMVEEVTDDCCLKQCNFKCMDDEECDLETAKKNQNSGKCPMAKCMAPKCENPKWLAEPYKRGDTCCIKQCNYKCPEEECTADLAKENEEAGKCPVADCLEPKCEKYKWANKPVLMGKTCCNKPCYYECDDDEAYNCNTREKWTDEKTKWCCAKEKKGCPKTFNCKTRETWTDEKKKWCCAKEGLGCPTCENQEECETPEDFCGDAVCVEGKCNLVRIACHPAPCWDRTFPKAIKGKCCEFEECPEKPECSIEVAKKNEQRGICPVAMCMPPNPEECDNWTMVDELAGGDGGENCCLKLCNFKCEKPAVDCDGLNKKKCPKKEGCVWKKKCMAAGGGGEEPEKTCKDYKSKSSCEEAGCEASMKKSKFKGCSDPKPVDQCAQHKSVKACEDAGCKAKSKKKRGKTKFQSCSTKSEPKARRRRRRRG